MSIVAKWLPISAAAEHLLYVCLFVGHAVNKINEVWQQIGCYNLTKFGTLIDQALLYIIFKIGKPKLSPGAPKLQMGKKFLHRSAECIETWHDDGY